MQIFKVLRTTHWFTVETKGKSNITKLCKILNPYKILNIWKNGKRVLDLEKQIRKQVNSLDGTKNYTIII